MTRKSGNRFSLATNAERVCAESMPKRDQVLIRFNWIRTEEMESVHGISRPPPRRFPGSGSKARSLWLPSGGIRPPPSEGPRAVKSPSFTAHIFHFVERALPRLA
jgi:hypothetical protein